MQNQERTGDWTQIYNGKKFWPLDPRPEDVCIDDIAHALSMICRFGGHCNDFYSVAQHSVLVSQNIEEKYQLHGLLHDSAEAYIGDIVLPLKKYMKGIKEIEKKIEIAIFEHFGLVYSYNHKIKTADKIVLYTEMRDLMAEPPEEWQEYNEYIYLLLESRIIPLNSKDSERLFLERYNILINKI